MSNKIYIVDVFTDQPYSGNPLAVVLCDMELAESTMQKIAAEMNFSETTFVKPQQRDNGGYDIRIYTPSREIEFAGHPLLGTAHIIRKQLKNNAENIICLNLMQTQVSVSFEKKNNSNEVAWFKAPKITLGGCVDSCAIANSLGLDKEDIDSKYPAQVLSAGTSAIIVPLNNLDALRKSKLNLDRFSSLREEGLPPLTYLFTTETYEENNDFCVRFFFDAYGVREDPATGNGAAFFGAYLLEHKYFPEAEISLRIEQGHEVRRPSLVLLESKLQGTSHDIRVGGYITDTVQGELF